jgi:hypothetical protein
MNRKRLEAEIEEGFELDFEESFDRTQPVSSKDVRRMTPVSILEKYLLKWPPRDVRFEDSYLRDHEFEFTDSLFMVDIADGMVLKVIERLPAENSITIGVYLQSNLAEFERYNAVVDQHNDAWEEQGCPEDVFDPRTGDINPIRDTLVKEAVADSPYRRTPEYDPSTGPLTKARPKTKRDLYFKFKVRLDVLGSIFKIGFVAWDAKNQIVYYNELQHKDIAYLTRRVIHELFGNPFINGNAGPLLDGIAHLIHGKKLALCVKFNEIPNWSGLEEYSVKTSNPVVTNNKVSEILFRISGAFFGYIAPIYIFWNFILVKSWHSMQTAANDKLVRGDPDWWSTVIGACVVLMVSFLLAKFCYRQANVLKLTSKIL